MGTRFEIAFPVGTAHAVAAAEDALDVIDELEDCLTIYRPESEVSQLNAAACHTIMPISETLYDILERSGSLVHATGGAFDPATGRLVDVWGFSRREGRIPHPADLAQALRESGFRHLILDSVLRTVKFRVPLLLNFGGIGKGYALDRAAMRLREHWGITSALLHGGGSSVYGLGSPPNDVRGWPIAIRHPWDESQHLQTVILRNQGLGTSAATYQFFEYKGKKYGHLLNPLTGRPAEGTASASCIAPTAAEADALSTAMFVRGQDWAERLCRSRSDLSAVILPDQPPEPTTGTSHARNT
jgi:thiamine biosynthesis lipoprotein